MAMMMESDCLLSHSFSVLLQAIPFPHLSYPLLPVLNEGGHKIGHNGVVRYGEQRIAGTPFTACVPFSFFFIFENCTAACLRSGTKKRLNGCGARPAATATLGQHGGGRLALRNPDRLRHLPEVSIKQLGHYCDGFFYRLISWGCS